VSESGPVLFFFRAYYHVSYCGVLHYESMAGQPTNSRVFLPAGGGIFFVLLLAMFLFRQPLQLLWDGGTCRHIVNGVKIFQEHAIPTVNYVWAINPQAPWVTHELLADIVFGATYFPWGLNGVVASCAIAIALSLTWTYQMALARGMTMIVGMIFTIAIMYAASIHWSARPHVLTYLPFLAMYWLVFCEEPSKKRTALVALCMVLWANLHGSFTLGLAMIGAKLVFRPMAELKAGAWKSEAMLLAVALAASCLNVRGPGFLIYVVEYMLKPVIAFRSGEWRALDLMLGPQVWMFVALAAVIVGVCAFAPKKPRLAEAAYVLFLLVFSVTSMRIIPYFVMAGLIAMAPSWASLPQWSFDQRLGKAEPQTIAAAAFWSVVAIAIAGFWLWSPGFKINDFDPRQQPVVTTDYMKEHNITGLGFNWDNYGDYIYWKLGKPIFIDDKTDFYPREFVEEYANLYFTRGGWDQVLQKYNFSWILIPNTTPLAQHLKKDQNWETASEDACSVLLVRKTVQAPKVQ
jgi:hypothetical protein